MFIVVVIVAASAEMVSVGVVQWWQ